jgi:GTP-binding protein EngB required for normal cell division
MSSLISFNQIQSNIDNLLFHCTDWKNASRKMSSLIQSHSTKNSQPLTAKDKIKQRQTNKHTDVYQNQLIQTGSYLPEKRHVDSQDLTPISRLKYRIDAAMQ